MRSVAVVEDKLEERNRLGVTESVAGPVGEKKEIALAHAPESGHFRAGCDPAIARFSKTGDTGLM